MNEQQTPSSENCFDTHVPDSHEELSDTDKPGRPWGFWATVGFTVLLFAIHLFIVIVLFLIGTAILKVVNPDLSMDQIMETIDNHMGFVSAVEMILLTLVGIPLLLLFASLRKGYALREYFGLHQVSPSQYGFWFIVVILFVAVSDLVTYLLGRDIVPEAMIEAYQTSLVPVLLIFAIVVCAPLSEEFYFRGFLFQSLRFMWIKDHGTILLTALFWASLHMQYDWYGVLTIFIGGILVGIARVQTGSISIPIFIHALMNLIASVELIVYLQYFEGGS